ncbi:hypothetical protein GJAV_G00085560 [Gymnothorax javanicus]|nr:hypothetical protein GJAV_G00085560 [Gymnothorax javanicus]
MDGHRGHDTASAAAERTEKQRLLGSTQGKVQQRIQEREKELQDLRQAVQSLKVGTDQRRRQQLAAGRAISGLSQGSPPVSQRSEVKELIRDQEKAEVSRAEGLLERLEQEIAELRRRDAELEQLSHTEDHIHFLQSCPSLCVPPGPGDLPSITVNPQAFFVAVKKSITDLKEQLEDVFKINLIKVSGKVEKVHMLEPKSREDFLQYSCQLTLDPNSVHRELLCQRGTGRIGVYLDHRAGTLSFYSVSDTMTLLHRVQTTFTQPLYPGFWVYNCGSCVKLCDLK